MSRSALLRWLSSFIPAPITVNWHERLRSCAGALLGIAFTGGATWLLFGPSSYLPLLIAPMGASAVLLFAVPASPLAQPWSLIGGNLVAATVGVTCASMIANPLIAASLAVGLAIGGMFALRCVHPPSGAVALTAVLGGPAVHAAGYGFVLQPVAFQSAALLGAALVYHALTGHRYPHIGAQSRSPAGSAAPDAMTPGFTRADLEAVLKRRGEMLDIDPGDLESLLRDTQLQAFGRSFAELCCEDIMSRRVVTAAPHTPVETARNLLKRERVKALPVVDAHQRIVGIVTRADLLEPQRARTAGGILGRVGRWLRHAPQHTLEVGAVMSTHVCSVPASAPITELVPMFANYGHHHIPVVDAANHLVGMITQVDLISGLHRQTHRPQ
ncbi:HPP family protein [Paraburkholderia bonniea]|uniref:HPP family protein n=1 Tax=Paraburkholderia bonniea TaxID=2152891 RepID=UPI0012922AAD|nr:HPP family protein [Paraburkholderia bonniea]